MASDTRERAESRSDTAFEDAAVQDPRAVYRERLRGLKRRDPDAFEWAVAYYEKELVRSLAQAESDPITEWLRYGRMLAEAGGTGRVVEIDTDGRAGDCGDRVPDQDSLTLHVPEDSGVPVLVLLAPRELSAAQQATMSLLVEGSTRLSP